MVDWGQTSAKWLPSTMPSPPSTRPNGSRERRSSAFVREDSDRDVGAGPIDRAPGPPRRAPSANPVSGRAASRNHACIRIIALVSRPLPGGLVRKRIARSPRCGRTGGGGSHTLVGLQEERKRKTADRKRLETERRNQERDLEVARSAVRRVSGESAAFSGLLTGCGGEVSAIADYLAERMELELPVFPVGRIGSESEPPNLATEINASRCPLSARNSPSPVPSRLYPSPKTRRRCGGLWEGRGLRPQSLCNRRLGGGGGSLVRTRLSLLSRENTGNQPD